MRLPEDHPEIVVYFIVALLFLWVGFFMLFFNEGGYHESRGELAIDLSIGGLLILVGLVLVRKIVRLFRRAKSQQLSEIQHRR
jgi:hypothetical protein